MKNLFSIKKIECKLINSKYYKYPQNAWSSFNISATDRYRMTIKTTSEDTYYLVRTLSTLNEYSINIKGHLLSVFVNSKNKISVGINLEIYDYQCQ